ncbi:MAG: YebC/PmpR family DNA-binding transcriptional regulator [Flavobacteriaceae bacterium]|nr:YebC/PmpR family DNA-binding transcriptional regulator [Flavobacteriaceae bacterium]|tara:strand:- start:2355 stop:3065 length:711 start_codon:yes stop_codon:yes gene_type:complete
MGRAFEFRKARKMKRWASMAKTFTRIGKDIVIAVKEGGPSPETNAKLRVVIQNAKTANMPKDNIQRAIKNASEKNNENYKEIVLEGYGPHGIAVIVDCTTDNNNRTVANIRSYFNKTKGNLGINGSVEYLFDKFCVFKIVMCPEHEELELELIDYGLEEMVIDDEENEIIIYAKFESFGEIQTILEKKNIEIKSSEIEKLPKKTIDLDQEKKEEFESFLEMCDEDNDVQKIHHNCS